MNHPIQDTPANPTLGHAEGNPNEKLDIKLSSEMSEGLKPIKPDDFNAILVNKLREENRRLREWISKHGSHGDYCEPILPNPDNKSTCTCGLDEILQGTREIRQPSNQPIAQNE